MYSTYLGGSGEDSAYCIAVDASGNAYITAFTDSTDFPIGPSPFQGTFGGDFDSVVVKLGDAVIEVTFDSRPGSDPN